MATTSFAQQQKSAESQTETVVSPETLQAKIGEVESDTNLDATRKSKLIEYYRKALTYLEQAKTFKENTETFITTGKTAPAETERLRKELEKKQHSTQANPKISGKATLAELEQMLAKEKSDLATIEAKSSDLNDTYKNLISSPKTNRERLIDVKRRQGELLAESNYLAPTDEPAELKQARKWAVDSRRVKLNEEIRMLDQELLSHQARLHLQEAQINDAEYEAGQKRARIKLLESELSKRRLDEALQAKKEAEVIRDELKGRHPLIRQLAESNLELGEQLRTRALELEKVTAQGDRVRKESKRIEEELETVRTKIEVAGLNQVLGKVLYEQRRALPYVVAIQREIGNRAKLIASSSLMQIQYDQERRALQDLPGYISSQTSGLRQDEARAIQSELTELAKNRKDLLDKAMANESTYLRALGELDLAQRRLINIVQSYDEFLATRLLWIRSTELLTPAYFNNLPSEVGRMLSHSSWLMTVQDLLRLFMKNPVITLVSMILIFLTLARKQFLRAAIATGNNVGKIRTDSFWLTSRALFFTILASAPLPLLLMHVGWQLSTDVETSEFSRAVAASLFRMARDFMFLLFFADLSLPGNVISKHLRWPAATTSKLHRQFRLLILLYLPLVFITILSYRLDKSGQFSGQTLLSVLTIIFLLGVILYRFVTPKGGVLAEYIHKNPSSFLARFRPVWTGMLIAINVTFFVLVLMGYLFTGAILFGDLLNSLGVIFLLVLAHSLVVRWLLLVRRRLDYKVLLEKREAMRAAREAEAKSAEESKNQSDEDYIEIEEPEINLAALDADSRKLLNTAIMFTGVIGLWLIWSPILPAFGILNDITVWDTTDIVDGVDSVIPVTLADLALALIIGIIAIKAAQGVPAFIEFALLQRMSLTAGGRYTVITLLRYTITGIGIVLFFDILGGKWSQIQWLVAALGVGIGFGLQEIVANFISGLIILFERPIRVGDTVTVGDVSGVVSRINIRATTITNFDRQELLVPNKEFITSRLLNWSLSDTIIRIRIPVGIAYGSDVTKAMKLMKEAAEEHENVLSDPAPSVTFESFGDNSLGLYLLAYVQSIDKRVRIITDLHTAINNKFNEVGIVISFPQRDVHLDTSEPLRINIEDRRQEKPA